MDVTNFPKYINKSNFVSPYLLQPSKLLAPEVNSFFGTGSVDSMFNGLLHKIFPNLNIPPDPHFVRRFGIADAMRMTDHFNEGKLNIDLGNLERGRPVITNTAMWGLDDWNKFNPRGFAEQLMYSNSAHYDRTPPPVIKYSSVREDLAKIISDKMLHFKRTGAVLGGGVGAVGGAAGGAIKTRLDKEENRTRDKYLKNMGLGALIGGGSGAVGGAMAAATAKTQSVNKAVNDIYENINSEFTRVAPHIPTNLKNEIVESLISQNLPTLKESMPPVYLEKELWKKFKGMMGKKAQELVKKADKSNKNVQKKPKNTNSRVKNQKTEIKNKKNFKINPYLAAGIPLTLASALSLRASIPATRMGARFILNKRFNKNYRPSEFINDYLEASHNMGKSPLNKLVKRIEVNARKTPHERLDEAAHWDAFTKSKRDGMDRWIHELDRNLGHNPKKQEAFRKKVEHFRNLIGNDPNKLHLAENDPVGAQILRRMALHNEPWGKKFGLIGGANTGAFGVGAGLVGKGTYDELSKTGAVFAGPRDADGLTMEEAAELGLGGVGGGVGIKNLLKAKKLMDSNTIGVTAGKIDKPIFESSTGMGHIAPAEAQYEELLRHPAVQSGEFKLDKLIRTHKGNETNWARGKDPSKNWLVTVENGFGGTMRRPHPGIAKSPVWHNPYGKVVFLPDPPPKDTGFFLQHPEKNTGLVDLLFQKGKLDRYKPVRNMGDAAGKASSKIRSMVGSNRELITFGPDYLGDHPEFSRLVNIPNAHPALADQTLRDAQKRLTQKLDREKVLNSLIEHAKSKGDMHSAQVLEEALKNNKKILTISGASRGDQVGSKAQEVIKYLNKKKRIKDYVVLALMGEGKGDIRARQVANMPGVASFGSLPRENYIAAQNLGRAHWGNTGASSYAEARSNTTPTAFSVNNTQEKLKEIKRLRQMGAPEELIRQLEQIDLDNWNAGTLRDLSGVEAHGVKGVKPVRSARDFVRFADEAGRINPEVMKNQAQRYIADAVEGKRVVADKLVEKARLARARSLRAGNIKNVMGGALLGGGTLLGLDAMIKKIKRKKKAKKNEARLMK